MNLKKFTLLELLLVIAIILILLSLIIPGIIKAQRQAELVVCTNNLRGIGTATALYHKDNKRYFPDAEGDDYLTSQEDLDANASAVAHLDKYLDNHTQIVVCPMNPNEDESYTASARNNNSYKNDLDGDLKYDGSDSTADPKRRSLKVSKVLRPSKMSLMVNTEVYYDGDDGGAYWHTLTNAKYPFLSVAGSVRNIFFSSGMGVSNTSVIDFQNE